ncbi:MAG: UDP-N-acetylmuramoyl-tripeptide--D-alanyl-D-alanine ligase, partial [Myxococcales bacterium]|nr:UDP-N-acetylmuramoyl-tripeptide--D-alanyl-D-alanine ligase [Myxococcales bacterium]
MAEITGGRALRDAGREVEGAFFDSRRPRAGGLFVPIVAARDGHDFIPQAVAGGAAAILQVRGRALPAGDTSVIEVEDTLAAFTALARDVRDRFTGPVIAITGSNGKTTTRGMIAAALACEGGFQRVLCTQGNFNNNIGVPMTLTNGPDEPDAMVIELGMNAPGEVDALASVVRPTGAVITSVAVEHLEFMGSIEAIAAAEA